MGWFDQPQGSLKEIILAGMPILLIAFVPGLLLLIPAVEQIPAPIGLAILLVMALLLVGLGLIGFVAKLPRWSFPYAGIFLTLTALFGLNGLARLGLFSVQTRWTFRWTVVFMAGFLILLFLMVAFMVFSAGRIRLFAPFVQMVRSDRTLLPFMMYGGSLVILMGSYEDVVDGGIFLVFSALAMLGGVGGYLKSRSESGRLLVLFLGSTLANLIALIANLSLSEIPRPQFLMIGPVALDRLTAFLGLTWLTSLAMIFLPLLLNVTGSQALTHSSGQN